MVRQSKQATLYHRICWVEKTSGNANEKEYAEVFSIFVPEIEPAWFVLMDLRVIAELIAAPVHRDESIHRE